MLLISIYVLRFMDNRDKKVLILGYVNLLIVSKL